MSLSTRFDTDHGWHRVHWFRLVELLGRGALAVLALFATGIPEGLGGWTQELIGVVVGLLAVVNYFSTRYRVTTTSVTTTKGVLFRSEETLERESVQTVTSKQPVWYRPLGLALVVIADDAGNELEIGPVTQPTADHFSAALQPAQRHAAESGGTSTVDATPTETDDGTTESDAPTVGDRPARDDRPSGSGVGVTPTTPESLSHRVDLPTWKAFVISVGDLGLVITLAAITATGYFGSWFVAAMIAAGAIWVPISEIVSLRRFRLTVADDEIRVKEGILTLTEERTTCGRSEFLRIDEPLAFRLLGLERVVLGNGDGIMTVSPAQPRGQWRRFAAPLLGVDPLDDSAIVPISSRSKARFQCFGIAVTAVLGALAATVDWRLGIAVGAVSAALTVWWYPQARLARFGLANSSTAVMTKESFAPRRTWLYRLDRIDASMLTSTPGQRVRSLNTLRFSGRSSASSVRVPDLDAAHAADWERVVTEHRPHRAERSSQRQPTPIGRQRRVERLPNAAIGAALLGKAPWAVLQLGLWTALMVGSRITDPPDSPWRSGWLLAIGTALVLASASSTLVLAWLRVRNERWTLTDRVVERRSGALTIRRRTTKRSHISAAKWSQGPAERRFGLGSVTLSSRGVSNPDLVLAHLAADDARDLTDLHRSTRGADKTARV